MFWKSVGLLKVAIVPLPKDPSLIRQEKLWENDLNFQLLPH